jgi:hypothetical protein
MYKGDEQHSPKRDDQEISPMILCDPLRTKLLDGLKSTIKNQVSTLRGVCYQGEWKRLKLPFGYQDGTKKSLNLKMRLPVLPAPREL